MRYEVVTLTSSPNDFPEAKKVHRAEYCIRFGKDLKQIHHVTVYRGKTSTQSLFRQVFELTDLPYLDASTIVHEIIQDVRRFAFFDNRWRTVMHTVHRKRRTFAKVDRDAPKSTLIDAGRDQNRKHRTKKTNRQTATSARI